MAHCSATIYQQVTLSGDDEWPKVADAMIEALSMIGGHPMWQQEFLWFFTIFHQEFRKNNPIAFEVLMV